MNDLGTVPATLTMDSREIAERTGKRHSDVCKDIETQLGQLEGGVRRFAHTYRNEQNGQEYRFFHLPRRETLILISGYSVELRAAIIDRWEELERAAVPRVPQSLAEALRLAADLEDKRLALESKIAADAPKVELANAIGRSDRQMSITDCAKHFGLHPKAEVFPYLRAHNYITRANLPTQSAINAGYLVLKEVKAQDGKVYPQAVVEAWQLENWRAHVVHQIKRWLHAEAGKVST